MFQRFVTFSISKVKSRSRRKRTEVQIKEQVFQEVGDDPAKRDSDGGDQEEVPSSPGDAGGVEEQVS